VLEVRNARRELEAEQTAQREDVVGLTAAVGVMPPRQNITLVIEQRVQDMQRLTRGGGDQLGIERRVAVRDMCVDLEPWPLAIMGVEPAGIAAKASSLEELSV
jgi:hypothetical protein